VSRGPHSPLHPRDNRGADHLPMDSRLAQLASLSQRDKGPAYVAVLNDVFANQPSPSFLADLHTLVDTVVNQDAGGLVVGRQVVSELVKAVTEGIVQNSDVKKQILQDTLNLVQPKIVSYEEPVEWLSHDYPPPLCPIYSTVWISTG
jgi:COP9 signalosome complex subunit 4